MELPVPSFRQGDERWSADALGGVLENGTLGSAGCAVAAAAMVFQSYGIDTDPQQLNWYLTAVGGYTEQGWLYWERVAWLAPDRVRHVYEDLPSYYLIDSNLARGNPVIVRVRFSSGVTHFVVIAGKQGFDYLLRDPGAGAVKGYYPLRELGSDIEALRFYEPLPQAVRASPRSVELRSYGRRGLRGGARQSLRSEQASFSSVWRWFLPNPLGQRERKPLRVCDQMWCEFAEHYLLAHLLHRRSDSFDLLLLLRDSSGLRRSHGMPA